MRYKTVQSCKGIQMFQRDVLPSFPCLNSSDGPTSLKTEKGEMAIGKIHGMGKVDRMKFESTRTMHNNCQR